MTKGNFAISFLPPRGLASHKVGIGPIVKILVFAVTKPKIG